MMALYFEGVVTCRDRKTAEVELTLEERDRLAAGQLPCPCCGTPCGALFTPRPVALALGWNGARWTAQAHGEH
jgi:hypothetical protein